jgi:hypothetical protein
VTAVLVVAVLVVLGHQAWRALGPGETCPDRHTGVSAWHALMAVAMAAMLAFTLPPLLAAAGAVLFAAGALWAAGAALHAPARGSGRRALHVRLGVACAAMVVMLWSDAAGATAAPGVVPVDALAAGSHHGAGLTTVHAHGALADSPAGTWLMAGTVLAVLVVAVLSARRAVVAGVRDPRTGTRADACCEAYMALLAAGMLAAPLLAGAAGA